MKSPENLNLSKDSQTRSGGLAFLSLDSVNCVNLFSLDTANLNG